jgi:hypothetical protein
MDSNTHSTQPPGPAPAGHLDDLAELTVVTDRLAAQDLDRLSDAVRAQRVLQLRQLLDRLEGHWLKELAGSTAAAQPAPNKARRSGRPRPGSGIGCAWGPGRRAAPSGPPEPCSGDR